MADKTKNTIPVTNDELKKLADIYVGMGEPNRSIFIMSGSLLLASQNANQKKPQPKRTG